MNKSPDSPATPSVLHTRQPQFSPDNVVEVAGQLPQANKLKVLSSNFFARNVQANIQRIKDSRRPLRLRLRNKCSVVIIDHQTYEELLHTKTQLIELVERLEHNEAANPPN
jgi:hypothetical protein